MLSNYINIDNCGHMMLLEEADRVLKVLKKFITANYPSIFK